MTQTQQLYAPFRADFVGSFLRPAYLIHARERFEAGQLDAASLRKLEDTAIADLIAKQKDAGLQTITDGEFRRYSWHLDFMWGLQGVQRVELSHGYAFHGIETYHTSVQITGQISGDRHPFVEDYRFVHDFESPGVVAKQTIPAPAQTLAEFFRPDNIASTRAAYPDLDKLIEDIAAAYRTVILDLYAAGLRNLQLDDCTWGMIVDPDYRRTKYGQDLSVAEEAARYLHINNLALEGLPADLRVNTHVCRGNYESHYAASGPYDAVAPILFGRERVHAYYLEYDDERSGGFEPLRYVGPDQVVVLGLITTKRPQLEDKEKVIARIREAAKNVPLERLCLSPQCGFASNVHGNRLTEDEQWAKIALVREIAREVWGTDE